MRGLNRVTLIGNLGNVPEFQTLEGGICVAKFSLATTEIFKYENGQNHTQTEWHNIVVWRSLADSAAKYLQKGSLVYIEGKIKTRNYEDKDGSTTIKSYGVAFEEFINHFPLDAIDEIDEKKIIEFCRYLVLERKVSASTQNTAINAIKFYI